MADTPYGYLVMLGSSGNGEKALPSVDWNRAAATGTYPVAQWRGTTPVVGGNGQGQDVRIVLHVQELLTLLERGVNIDGI